MSIKKESRKKRYQCQFQKWHTNRKMILNVALWNVFNAIFYSFLSLLLYNCVFFISFLFASSSFLLHGNIIGCFSFRFFSYYFFFYLFITSFIYHSLSFTLFFQTFIFIYLFFLFSSVLFLISSFHSLFSLYFSFFIPTILTFLSLFSSFHSSFFHL